MSNSQEPIREDCRVVLYYALTLADGTMVDAASADKPAEIVIGRGELFESLERRLMGLHAGDRRRFDIPASETASLLAERALQRFAAQDFPSDISLTPGTVVGFSTPTGAEVPGRIVEVTSGEVLVDFVHPLAGHGLVFDVEIVDVAPCWR